MNKENWKYGVELDLEEMVEMVGKSVVEKVLAEACEFTGICGENGESEYFGFSAHTSVPDGEDNETRLEVRYRVENDTVEAAGDDLGAINWKNNIAFFMLH